MPASLKSVFLLVAVVLFVLAAVPPLPYASSLIALGLAFFAAAEAVG